MRYLVGFMCVLALGVMPMVGCGETAGAGGAAGDGGAAGMGGGGAGGDGGIGGDGGGGTGGITLECETAFVCSQLTQEICMVACVEGLCELGPVEDGGECFRGKGSIGICAGGECRAPCETADDCYAADGNDCTAAVCAPGGYCGGQEMVEDGTPCAGGTCQAGVCELIGSVLPCTEQGIRNALFAGGGPYTFDCDRPTRVPERFRIERHVILDGERNLIVHQFDVSENVVAELRAFKMTGCRCFGVVNRGTLTLANSTVSRNAGGIANLESGNMTVTGVTVSNGWWGGIRNFGQMTLTNSTVSNNTHSCNPENEFCLESGAGGIYNTGTLTLTNCTVSGNVTTNGRAGAISNLGTLTLTNCTVSELEGPSAHGWTIVNHEGKTLAVANTLIDGDCTAGAGATTTSNGYNIESPYDTCGFDQLTDQVNVSADNLNLWLLADNGGPTETHALLPGSVAIDVIPADMCEVDEDQRGEPRDSTCDVGSFEVQP